MSKVNTLNCLSLLTGVQISVAAMAAPVDAVPAVKQETLLQLTKEHQPLFEALS